MLFFVCQNWYKFKIIYKFEFYFSGCVLFFIKSDLKCLTILFVLFFKSRGQYLQMLINSTVATFRPFHNNLIFLFIVPYYRTTDLGRWTDAIRLVFVLCLSVKLKVYGLIAHFVLNGYCRLWIFATLQVLTTNTSFNNNVSFFPIPYSHKRCIV